MIGCFLIMPGYGSALALSIAPSPAQWSLGGIDHHPYFPGMVISHEAYRRDSHSELNIKDWI